MRKSAALVEASFGFQHLGELFDNLFAAALQHLRPAARRRNKVVEPLHLRGCRPYGIGLEIQLRGAESRDRHGGDLPYPAHPDIPGLVDSRLNREHAWQIDGVDLLRSA